METLEKPIRIRKGTPLDQQLTDPDTLQHMDELDTEWVNAWRKTVC